MRLDPARKGQVSGPQPAANKVSEERHPLTAAADTLQTRLGPAVSEAARLTLAVEQARAMAEGRAIPLPEKDRPKGPEDPGPAIRQPIYSGGAPALERAQMDEAVIQNSLTLRILYALEDRAPWLLKAYEAGSKVMGPLGAIFNFGFNAWQAKDILRDPHAHPVEKVGIVASTSLAGVSAVTAARLSLAALKVAPMGIEAMKAWGRVAGLSGVGAGAVLAAVDTFQTFRDPKSTPAQKGFSTLTTAAAVGSTVALLIGVTGPVGIGLAVAGVAFMLAKGFLGKNRVANQVFGTIGKGFSAVGHALGHLFG